MNDRERFAAVMEGRPGLCPPNYELGIWGQTVDRWISEGASEDELEFDWFRGGRLGLDRREFAPVYLHADPPFETVVLEENDETMVVRDWQGVVTRRLKTGMARGYAASMDQHLSHPVRDRASFLEMKERYDPHSPARYPEDWDELVAGWRDRDCPLCLLENGAFGLFSHLRVWMGTEALCVAFYDQRDLIEEMLDFLVEFFREATSRAVGSVQFDYFNFFEDMAFKTQPFTSPGLFRELLLPRYRTVIEHLGRHGVRFIWLDSDGNTELLLPLFIEMGVTCLWPFEVAAGMDPVRVHREYGEDLRVSGGIDKRVLATGKEAIEHELRSKLPPLLEDGGYIPTIDHMIPHDVPYESFLYYMELKAELMGAWGG